MMEALFGEAKPIFVHKKSKVTDNEIASLIVPRTLLPWTAIYSPANNMVSIFHAFLISSRRPPSSPFSLLSSSPLFKRIKKLSIATISLKPLSHSGPSACRLKNKLFLWLELGHRLGCIHSRTILCAIFVPLNLLSSNGPVIAGIVVCACAKIVQFNGPPK